MLTFRISVNAFLVLPINHYLTSRNRFVKRVHVRLSLILFQEPHVFRVLMITRILTLIVQNVSNVPKVNMSTILISHNVSHVQNRRLITTPLWISVKSAHGMLDSIMRLCFVKVSVCRRKYMFNRRIHVFILRILVRVMRSIRKGKTSAFQQTLLARMINSTTHSRQSVSHTHRCASWINIMIRKQSCVKIIVCFVPQANFIHTSCTSA